MIKKIADEVENQLASNEKLKSKAKEAWEFLSKWEVVGIRYHGNENKIEPYQALNQLVNMICSLIKQVDEIDGLVILIDEADRPDVSANLGQFSKTFTEALVKKDCNQVLLGLAGQSSLIKKLRDSHESAPRVFAILTLQPLKTEESERVIEAGLKLGCDLNGTDITITSEAKELLVTLSEGYPHFIQQFSYSAFDADTDNEINDTDVLSGAFSKNGAIPQLGHIYFKEQYFDSIKSDDYRIVLNVMAEHLDDWVTRKEIIETTGFKEHTVNNALSALKIREIIIANESVKGQYRLPTKSFATWIKALSFIPKNIKNSSNFLSE